MKALTHQLTPVVTAHGANTNGAVEIRRAALHQDDEQRSPAGRHGWDFYTLTLNADGGKGALTWSEGAGFPSWLSLSADGVLSGTPDATGDARFHGPGVG